MHAFKVERMLSLVGGSADAKGRRIMCYWLVHPINPTCSRLSPGDYFQCRADCERDALRQARESRPDVRWVGASPGFFRSKIDG